MMLFVFWISIYLVVMTLIGHLSNKRVKTLEDYLIAGRKLPFNLVVPTLVATCFGAGSCLGVSGSVYSQGFYAVIADPFGCSLALLIAGFFYAVPFRKLGVITISDLLAKSYGRHFELSATLLMVPFYAGTLASQMLAMGHAFEIFLGGSFEYGVLIGSFVIVMYTVTGGMWAVTITDFVQLVLLVIALLLVLNISLTQVSDLEATFKAFFHEFTLMGPRANMPLSNLSYAGRLLMTGLGCVMGQDFIQRILSSKSGQVARNSTVCAAFIYFTIGLIPLFIGVAGREIIPNLNNAEQLIPVLAKTYMSPLAFTLFACGLLSAIMSTADSYLLAGTSLIAKNIVFRIWPIASERAKIRLVRIINILLALVALGLAFSGQTIFDLMVHSGATLFVAIFVPTSAALFLKKASLQAAWSSLCAGLVTWVGFIVFASYRYKGLTYDDILFSAAAFGGIFSLLAYTAVAVWNRRSLNQQVG